MKVVRLLAAAVALAGSHVVVDGRQTWRTEINDASVAALKTWVNAVRTHTPGTADDAVVTIGLTYEKREDLNTGMSLFLASLMDWGVEDAEQPGSRMAGRGRSFSGRDFLKRAAVLHADAAAYGDLHPRPVSAGKRAQGRQEIEHGKRGRPENLSSAATIPPAPDGRPSPVEHGR